MIGALRDALDELAETGFIATRMNMPEFYALARSLGSAVSARKGGPLFERISPTPRDQASPRSLSSVYGLGAFPFHTDAAHHRVPPRYVAMRLAEGARSNTPTMIVDLDPSRLSRGMRATLRREMWLVAGGLSRTFYAPILDRNEACIRFDPGCMRQPAGTTLTGGSMLLEHIRAAELVQVDWESETTLVLDNWRLLHSRAPASLDDCSNRTLLRCLLT